MNNKNNININLNKRMQEDIQRLFNRFANEENVSSFAVNSLLNQTLQICNKYRPVNTNSQTPKE